MTTHDYFQRILSSIKIYFAFFLLCITFVFSLDYPLSTFIFKNILPYDQQRLLELFLIMVVPVFFMLIAELRQSFFRVIENIALKNQLLWLTFFCLGYISCCFAKNHSDAFLEWSLTVLLFLFALCFSVLMIEYREKCINLLLCVLYLSIAAYVYPVCEAIYYSVIGHTPIHFFPYFINIRFFTQFAIFMMPLLPLADLYFVEKGYRFYGRVLIALLAIFWWALFILNGSRGAIYALIIAAAVMLCFFRKNLLPWLWRQLCYIGAASVISYLLDHASHKTAENHLVQQQLSHLHAFSESTLTPRLALYHYAFHLIRQHPLLGVGPMHYAYGPPQYLIQAGHLATHPHNFMLLILAEWGIPAGAAVGIFLLMAFFHGSRWCLSINRAAMMLNRKIAIASVGMSLLAGLLCALVSGVTVTPLSQIWLAVVAGVFVGLYRTTEKNAGHCVYQSHWLYAVIVGVMMMWSVITIAVVVIPEVPTLKQTEITWLVEHGLTSKVSPRFWIQGWISD